MKLRLLGLAPAVALVACAQLRPITPPPAAPTPLAQKADNELRIHWLNTGSGGCVIVECPGGRTVAPMVVDCGSRGSGNDSLTKQQATQYLADILSSYDSSVRVNLVLSHADIDHTNWVRDVLERVDLGHVWMSGALSDYGRLAAWLSNAVPDQSHLHHGLRPNWNNGGQPLGSDLSCGTASNYVLTVNTGGTPNSRSLVLLTHFASFAVIFPGDATGQTEEQAIQNYIEQPGTLNASILAGSHHGADTAGSNSERWARATSPYVVVFSSGDLYHHPRCSALNTYWEYVLSEYDEHAFRCGRTFLRIWGWYVKRTRKNVFTTYSSGTLVATADDDANVELQCFDGRLRPRAC